MRYFHLSKNKYHCPIINLDKIWNLVGEQVSLSILLCMTNLPPPPPPPSRGGSPSNSSFVFSRYTFQSAMNTLGLNKTCHEVLQAFTDHASSSLHQIPGCPPFCILFTCARKLFVGSHSIAFMSGWVFSAGCICSVSSRSSDTSCTNYIESMFPWRHVSCASLFQSPWHIPTWPFHAIICMYNPKGGH